MVQENNLFTKLQTSGQITLQMRKNQRIILTVLPESNVCDYRRNRWRYHQYQRSYSADRSRNALGHLSRRPWTRKTRQRPHPEQAARAGNAIQKYVIENTRFGIPVFLAEEAPHGHMAIGTTVFPTGLGMAATWNPELMHTVGEIIGREVRSQGGHISYGPVLDLSRDPRWSRVEETFGEDPLLAGRMGVCYGRRPWRAIYRSLIPLLPRLSTFLHMLCPKGTERQLFCGRQARPASKLPASIPRGCRFGRAIDYEFLTTRLTVYPVLPTRRFSSMSLPTGALKASSCLIYIPSKAFMRSSCGSHHRGCRRNGS